MGINSGNTIIKNFGTITGTGHGIVATQNSGNTKTFYNEGSIDVTEIALNITNYTNAVNNGTVRGRTGLYSLNNDILNDINGRIIGNDLGINSGNSNILNKGIIESSETGIYSETSNIVNEGLIKGVNAGIKAINGTYLENKGNVESDNTGVRITSGSNQYSSHFRNSGIINALDYSVKFTESDNVLELLNGTDISGKIDGGSGENILVVNGNIKLNGSEVNNFNKLIVSGDSLIDGIINLNPSTNSDYYTETFSNSKDLRNISSETSVGSLTVSGTINVGVDYDNIVGETDKTGKIITNSLKLVNGGNIVLENKGGTINDLITEAQNSGTNDKISIKNIVISNKQQAVNPDFKFNVSNDLEVKDGWKRETVSRIENGTTVLDEVYTKVTPPTGIKPPVSIVPPTEVPAPEEEKPVEKLNAVPRNRVDLDNLNKLESSVNRFVKLESSNMNVGEHRISIEYTGNKFDSKFKTLNNYNYNYDTKSNGMAGSTVYKQSENFYAGFALAYSNNDVNYSNNDSEKIDSFNASIFGKYNKNEWDFSTRLSYGFNRHELTADWVGLGIANSDYNSHVLKTGVNVAYNKGLFQNKLNLRPNAGIDYTWVTEDTIRTLGMSNIDSTHGDGFTGVLGIDLGSVSDGKVQWNVGANYKYNFTETFHKNRDMNNGYKMEKLDYNKNSVTAYGDLDFKVSEKFKVKTGYEYEYNKNYENHSIKAGISYLLK